MLDTRVTVETPEGVDLLLTPAGPAVRSQAWFIDALFKAGIYFAGALALLPFGPSGAGIFLILFFAVAWLYPVLFEVLSNGATPGKRMAGIRVVHANGTPVGWTASMIRNLLRPADFLPMAYALGLISCFLSSDFRRLGDLAAGTLVVYSERRERGRSLPDAEPLAPPVALSVAEQQAIVDFSERTSMLTPERAGELAAILHPMTGAARARSLHGMAQWIAGRR